MDKRLSQEELKAKFVFGKSLSKLKSCKLPSKSTEVECGLFKSAKIIAKL